MIFEDEIKKFGEDVEGKVSNINSEETTKTALINPFLRLMGYDTTDPAEVQYEYTADIGSKQNEKVDIAILSNGDPEILIECKPAYTELDETHISQLYRYFSITKSRIGLLTNGVVYKFFTDTSENNIMDDSPFIEVDLTSLSKKDIEKLEKFRKENYNLSKILSIADGLKYNNSVEKALLEEIEYPSDEMVRVIAKKVYTGTVTKKIVKTFRKIITNSFETTINKKVDKRLQEALKGNYSNSPNIVINEPEILTTPEELEGWYIIRAISSDIIDSVNTFYRDPVTRLYFKWTGVLNFNNRTMENITEITEWDTGVSSFGDVVLP